jgi:hypothetical protein
MNLQAVCTEGVWNECEINSAMVERHLHLVLDTVLISMEFASYRILHQKQKVSGKKLSFWLSVTLFINFSVRSKKSSYPFNGRLKYV